MHTYPTLSGSYTENQQALLALFGLTSPSQAPFTRIPCFMAYTEETKKNLDSGSCPYSHAGKRRSRKRLALSRTLGRGAPSLGRVAGKSSA